MKIAFLGTGRMGTELALHLMKVHELTVWNRSIEKTERLKDEGASVASTPAEAVEGAEVVVTSLFGPKAVREVVIEPKLIPEGILWIDSTTVSPEVADEFADAVPTYVAAPVVGTLGPARKGSLGVYVGGADSDLRKQAAELVAPWAADNPDRLRVVDAARKAAVGKLMANLALAVSAQGFKEALLLADATNTPVDEALSMLDFTGLEFIKKMKAPFVTGERETSPGDFTVNALAKDSRFMLELADLPAVRAALESFEAEQDKDRGDDDFSSILVNRNEK